MESLLGVRLQGMMQMDLLELKYTVWLVWGVRNGVAVTGQLLLGILESFLPRVTPCCRNECVNNNYGLHEPLHQVVASGTDSNMWLTQFHR